MRSWYAGLPPYLQATVFALIGTVMAAMSSVLVRLVTAEIDPLQAVFFRNFFGLIMIAPFALRSGVMQLKTHRLPMFGLRALLSMGAMS
ncbi:MAG TPA: RNA polymerase subunit sigma-54, partial [Thalassospira lucentensis]|nr:RNA polymerase subunit sigma-54 [Thalassospira lucentensis]